MQSKSLVSLFFSRTIAGALVAAVCAFGAPALAQEPPPASDLQVTKTGEVLPGGQVQFTIVVSNEGGAASDFSYLYDALPGFGVLTWVDPPFESDSGSGCGIFDNNAPIVGQFSLECDMDPLAAGGSYTIILTSIETVDTLCLALENTVSIYDQAEFPNLNTDWDQLPFPPTDRASASLSVGFCEGRMTGGGSIFTEGLNKKGAVTDIRVTHGFQLRCDASDPRQNLEINWPNPDGNQNNFHLTKLTSATCFYDDTLEDPRPPQAGFNTFIGEGEGRCNGLPATILFTFTDQGEPGTKDTAAYDIGGGCTLLADEANLIKKGNQQAHKN